MGEELRERVRERYAEAARSVKVRTAVAATATPHAAVRRLRVWTSPPGATRLRSIQGCRRTPWGVPRMRQSDGPGRALSGRGSARPR